MQDLRNYIENYDTMDDAIEALTDDARDEIDDIITGLDNSDLMELYNEYAENNYYNTIFPVAEIDDIIGKIYPSEYENLFSSDFSFNDDYAIQGDYGYSSSDDISDLMECDYDDLIEAVMDESISTRETDDIIYEYNHLMQEVENFEELKQGLQAEKIYDALDALVDEIKATCEIKDIKAIMQDIRNGMII